MFLTTALSALVLGATGLRAQAQAVTAPPQVTVTNVIVSMVPKPGVERDDVMKVMPDEIRETVQLYLKGKIEQWYFRGDGRGVVIILRAKTLDEAKAMVETLPLDRAGLVSIDYVPVGPLVPLGLLAAKPAQEGGSH
jgi:hypothetical protein